MLGIKAANAQRQHFQYEALRAQQDARASHFQRRFGDAFAGVDFYTGRPILWRTSSIPLVIKSTPAHNQED
jgi:hypothetical protein